MVRRDQSVLVLLEGGDRVSKSPAFSKSPASLTLSLSGSRKSRHVSEFDPTRVVVVSLPGLGLALVLKPQRGLFHFVKTLTFGCRKCLLFFIFFFKHFFL